MIKQIIALGLCAVMKANAFTLPDHLYVIPLKHPTGHGIDLGEHLGDIDIPDNLQLTFQLRKDFEGSCQEMTVTSSNGYQTAFNVCTKDED